MRFVLATLGSRGDVEPCAAIGRELQRRGHEVQMAVPPNMVGFVESAGLAAIPHGPDHVVQNANIAHKYRRRRTQSSWRGKSLRDVNATLAGAGSYVATVHGADWLFDGWSQQARPTS